MKRIMKNKYYNKLVLTEELPLNTSNRDDVLNWIYDIHIVEWYSTYLLKKGIDDDLADKIQEIYLMLCEVPQEKWDKLFQQGKFAISSYVTGVVHQQLWSTTSKIYTKYGRYNATQITQDEIFWDIYDEN